MDLGSNLGPYIILLLISTTLLEGCASSTLEELEAEALASGDWSKVERRERRLREEQALRDLCPPRTILYCPRTTKPVRNVQDALDQRCSCEHISTGFKLYP